MADHRPLTDKELEALDAVVAKATQEEWEVHDLGSTIRDDEGDWTVIEITRGDYLVADLYAVEGDPEDRAKELATAHAVALMHNAAPSLVAEVRRSREVAGGLAGALDEFLADAAPTHDGIEEVCKRFLRETGFLAPGKDEAAAVNSGVTIEQRHEAWSAWARKRMDVRNARARAALAKARQTKGGE